MQLFAQDEMQYAKFNIQLMEINCGECDEYREREWEQVKERDSLQ